MTPIQKMIEAVDKGYNLNPTLWAEWKATLLEDERLNNQLTYEKGKSDGMKIFDKMFDETNKLI